MENPFLIKKYPDLPGSKPVESAVKKARQEGKKVHGKEERVDAYLERIERLAEHERGFPKLKTMVLDRFVLDVRNEDVLNSLAENLYESEKRIAIEQGRGADIARLESGGDILRKYKPLILEKAEIQRKTLSSWLDYLQKNDAKHPASFRYFVVRSLKNMGLFDKEQVTYSKRSGMTIAPFPELNSEALGWVYRKLNEGIKPGEFPPEKEEILKRLIEKKDFSGLYALAQIETAGRLNRESLVGEWRKYDQGSDFRLLEKDLQGKGTGWCTAEGSAEGHLGAGDFYVYFTKGSKGDNTEPRVAIRMEDDHVAEVRGVNPRQGLEPELVDIAQEKYHPMPGGEAYDKKASDMKRMTLLMKQQEQNQPFSPDDLRFLYEFDAPIEGFSYDRDDRIDTLRDQREKRTDLCTIFSCTEEELQEKEHVRLKNIPNWTKLPADLKKQFKFDWVWKQEYREGRSMEDFEVQNNTEAEPIAKVFDITDVIRNKREKDHNHPNSLTTAEVLEAIDEAGYRPATLEELVAFGRDYWKPDIDSKSLSEEERVLQNTQAQLIYGLNTAFSASDGRRYVPNLYWNGVGRLLIAYWLEDDWDDHHRFLVLRKASS